MSLKRGEKVYSCSYHPIFVQITIVGLKDSGKTSVGERLVSFLVAKGKSVVAIKDHRVHLEEEGTDTWRYAKAGAHRVFIAGQNGTFEVRGQLLESRSEKEVAGAIREVDVAVFEGGTVKGFVLAVVAHGKELDETLKVRCSGEKPDAVVYREGGEHVPEGIPSFATGERNLAEGVARLFGLS